MSTQFSATFGGPASQLDSSPWRLSGVVVGAAINDPQVLAALGGAARAAPYKAPPRGPVLYVKPRNTLRAGGADVPVPPDVDAFGDEVVTEIEGIGRLHSTLVADSVFGRS